MKKPVKKWKIIVAVALAVIIGGGAGYVVWRRADSKLLTVTLAEVSRTDIAKVFSTSAPVESSSQSLFQVLDGVKVSSVNVKVGDSVKAGDVLATFDTSSLDGTYDALKREKDNALTKYNDALTAAESAAAALPALEKEIEALQSQEDASGSSSSGGISDILSNLNVLELLLGGGDMSSILSGMMGSGLTSQTSLLQLQLQKIVLETQMSESYLNTLKTESDEASAAYDIYTMQLNGLRNGWKAEKHGIVAAVNIKAGESYVLPEQSSSDILSGLDLSSLLASMGGEDLAPLLSMLTGGSGSSVKSSAGIGMLIENYDEFVAKFSLGKYDMQNVKVGQKAVVSAVNDSYEAEVSYVSATASSSSSVDISSMLSSISGISGGASNTAEGIITIKQPDEGLVIGFDVEIAIITDESFNTISVPVEAVKLDDNERFVYIYNEKDSTVSKRYISLGISDDANWEILEGLAEGEKIVRTFSGSSKLVDDGGKVKLAK